MKKTIKLVTKRIRIKKKTLKAIRKKTCQSHYNSKDCGNVRRSKRKPQFLSKKIAKKIISLTN
jgi:ribosomal protein L35